MIQREIHDEFRGNLAIGSGTEHCTSGNHDITAFHGNGTSRRKGVDEGSGWKLTTMLPGDGIVRCITGGSCEIEHGKE
jgi:hypothetical protein